MRGNLTVLCLSFFCLIWISSCGPKTVRTKTEMYQLFERDFKGFHPPDVAERKPNWGSKTFPYVKFDEVWNASLILLMQEGVVIRSSKESGVIVGVHYVPFIMFVERAEPVNVYIDVIEDLYRRLDDPEKSAVVFKPSTLHKAFKNILDKLATQVYAGNKWKYLYEDRDL